MGIIVINSCSLKKAEYGCLIKSVDLSDEIMGASRARQQWLAQLALSCRQVSAHLRQALQPTEPPPTPNYHCFTEFCRESASFPARVTLTPNTTSEQFIEHTVNQSLLMAERWDKKVHHLLYEHPFSRKCMGLPNKIFEACISKAYSYTCFLIPGRIGHTLLTSNNKRPGIGVSMLLNYTTISCSSCPIMQIGNATTCTNSLLSIWAFVFTLVWALIGYKPLSITDWHRQFIILHPNQK